LDGLVVVDGLAAAALAVSAGQAAPTVGSGAAAAWLLVPPPMQLPLQHQRETPPPCTPRKGGTCNTWIEGRASQRNMQQKQLADDTSPMLSKFAANATNNVKLLQQMRGKGQ